MSHLFDDRDRRDASRAVLLVEHVIRELGVDPAGGRVDEEGEVRFALRRGSARMLVTIREGRRGSLPVIRLAAPVIRLPEPSRRAALYEYLLQLNLTVLRGVAFGITEEEVLVIAERSVRDLDVSEVRTMVRTVGEVADDYDDRLAQLFYTTRASDPR